MGRCLSPSTDTIRKHITAEGGGTRVSCEGVTVVTVLSQEAAQLHWVRSPMIHALPGIRMHLRQIPSGRARLPLTCPPTIPAITQPMIPHGMAVDQSRHEVTRA